MRDLVSYRHNIHLQAAPCQCVQTKIPNLLLLGAQGEQLAKRKPFEGVSDEPDLLHARVGHVPRTAYGLGGVDRAGE